MDIKNSILGIPYNDVKEYIDTRIQFESLILDKKHRTILDEVNKKIDSNVLTAGKNINIENSIISAKGYTYNEAYGSFSQGLGTVTTNQSEHAEGIYNKSNEGTLYSIGVGTSSTDRQNAIEVLNNGNVYIKDIDNFDGTNPQEADSLQQIINTLLKDRIVLSAHINSLTRKVSDLLHTLYEPKVKFIDLGLSVKWAQYNEGVDTTQLTTAAAWYGNYYAWGETTTKSTYSTATYKYYDGEEYTKYNQTDGKTGLEKIDDVYENMFYKYFQYQYRMPTGEEIRELISLPNKWVENFNGVSGLHGRVFARTQSELDGDFNDDTMLFIPASGYHYGTSLLNGGLECYLWSSNLTGSDTHSYALWSANIMAEVQTDLVSRNRVYGIPVRCVSTDYIISEI